MPSDDFQTSHTKMTEITPSYDAFSSQGMWSYLMRWRKLLIVTGLTAALASVLFSGPTFIKPLYKSTVILYPATTNSISKALLSENAYDRSDPLAFGEEEEAEQLLQLLNSDLIRNRIIEKYKLMEHYEIKADDPFRQTKLYKRYEGNIKFRRTEYMSVEISVLDTDPETAAKIANDIAALLDETKNLIQLAQARKALEIVENQYNKKEAYIRSLNDSLNLLRSLGIFDYDMQIDHTTDLFVQAMAGVSDARAKAEVYKEMKMPATDTAVLNNLARLKGYEASGKRLQEQLNLLGQYGGAHNSLKEQLEKENEELVKLRQKRDQTRVDVDEVLPVKFIVNDAAPAEKKTYPLRSLIVLISTVSSLLLCLLLIVLAEQWKIWRPEQS
jgi:uncharacterized protein involved in exopolysaccharide biosynthesis